MSDETPPGSEASRVAQVMGLRDWQQMGGVELAEMVAAGLPWQTAETIVRRIDPVGQALTIEDVVSRSSLRRKRAGDKPLTKAQSQMVYALAKLFLEVERFYHSEVADARRFLAHPHPMLDGRSPIDVAKQSTVGVEVVLSLLERADAGVAV